MNIAICEDNQAEKMSLAAYVYYALRKKNVDAKIQSFSKGRELLLRHTGFIVYFLDIYLEDMSGIEIAYKIRKNNPDAFIIFTTASNDFMAEGYKVGAIHYLLKPIAKEAVEEAVDRILRWTREYERYITLYVDRVAQKILLSDILMVESKDKSCIITTHGSKMKSYIKLGEVEEMLEDGRFLRCHRSYLINMDYVQNIKNGHFILEGEIPVPIKRDKRVEMRQRYYEYCFITMQNGEKIN